MKIFYTREEEDDSEIFSTPTTLKYRNRSKIGSWLVLMIFGLAVFMPSNMNAQNPNLRGVAPVDNPTGGFDIDADLYANFRQPGTATNFGDWIYDPALYPGTGRGVLNISGTPINPLVTRHSIDLTGTGDLDGFVEGSKFNMSPEDWVIEAHSNPGKDDMQNVMIHFDYAANGDLWFMMAGDRNETNGTSYLDFELFQKTVALDGAGGYTSEGTDGGRTVGDLVISIEYSQGGARPQVFVYRWESVGTKGGVEQFDYVEYTTFPAGTVYAASNIEGPISVPYGAFGSTTYAQYAFVEAAVNLFEVIPDIDRCKSIATILIKTKASDALNAALKDVVEPIQIEINPNPAPTIANLALCESVAGGGGASFNLNEGVTDADGGTITFHTSQAFADAGTNAIETPETYLSSGETVFVRSYNSVTTCYGTTSFTLTVYDSPDASLITDGVCAGADAVFTASPNGSDELYTFFTDSDSDGVIDAGETILQAESTDNTYNSSSLVDGAIISVLVETTDGCTDSASAAADIFANPIASLLTDGVCAGADAVFTASPNGSDELYTFFTDSDSDGFIDAGETILQAESTDNTYNSSSLVDGAIISVLVETTDGCTGSASAAADIFANPIVSLLTDGVCAGADAVFTASPNGSDELYTFFTDSDSDGVIDAGETILQAESTDNTYNSSSLVDGAIISVLVETTDGCTDSASAAADIFANPIASLLTDGVCAGADAVFTASPNGSDELYTFFTDSDSDGVIDAGETILQAESTDNTYNSSSLVDGAIISVLVETTDGCTDSASAAADIFANPIASLLTDGVCAGADAVFTASPNGSDELYTFFTDSDSDGFIDAGETILQAESTDNTYNSSSLVDGAIISVLVETTDGCTGSASAAADIFANPIVSLLTDGVCAGADAVFTASPNGSDELYTFFTDSDSDGVIDAGETILQAESTDNTYNSSSLVDGAIISVLVETTDGCTGLASAAADIFANPNLLDATVCVGQTVNMGIGAGTYSSSNTNIATVSSSGVVSGISAGNAVITYTDLNGCSDTATVTVQNCIVDEGCTPGYWKNHLEAWGSVDPNADFFVFFGIDDVGNNVQDIIGDMDQNADGKLTLLEAISAEIKTSKNSGWFAALARHAVAAYLNASNPDVGYEFSTTYILEQTRIVFETNYTNRNQANSAAQLLHNRFRIANERVCPLGNETRSALADTSVQKLADPVILEESVVVADFSVSPVPFRESLSVRYDFDYVSDATIQMYDLQGRLLLTQKEANASQGKITDLSINFRILPSQVYVIKVTTDRDVFTKKIISDN